jgi:threonine/homoserine/homoserine lactone efflux protein
MLKDILIGAGFAFAAGIQPGPLQAFLLSKVVDRGWRRTMPAAFAPLISDGPIAILVLWVLRRLPVQMERGLHLSGGIVLLAFAILTWRTWRRSGARAEPAGTRPAPRTIFEATLVNLMNPGPYLGWSFVLGPAALTAWRESPANAVALVVSFYAVMVVTLGLTILLFGATRFLGPGNRRRLLFVSATILAALGVAQIFTGVRVSSH